MTVLRALAALLIIAVLAPAIALGAATPPTGTVDVERLWEAFPLTENETPTAPPEPLDAPPAPAEAVTPPPAAPQPAPQDTSAGESGGFPAAIIVAGIALLGAAALVGIVALRRRRRAPAPASRQATSTVPRDRVTPTPEPVVATANKRATPAPAPRPEPAVAGNGAAHAQTAATTVDPPAPVRPAPSPAAARSPEPPARPTDGAVQRPKRRMPESPYPTASPRTSGAPGPRPVAKPTPNPDPDSADARKPAATSKPRASKKPHTPPSRQGGVYTPELLAEFAEGLSDNVLDRAIVMFDYLHNDGVIDAEKLAQLLDAKPGELSGMLLSPLRRRANQLGVDLPYEVGKNPANHRRLWRDRDDNAKDMYVSLRHALRARSGGTPKPKTREPKNGGGKGNGNGASRAKAKGARAR